MLTRRQSIDNFKKHIDELINKGFTLSDTKLTDLMRSISTSEMFYSLFDYCTQDFDYDEAFSAAFVQGDGYAKGRFVLPADPKKQIALIFSVLYQINTKEIDFYNLLEKYFYVSGYEDNYRKFAIEVLLPFRAEVLRAVEAMMEGDDPVITPDEHTDAPKTRAINADDAETVLKLLEESRAIILQYKIDAVQKGEVVDLYQNFKDALFEGEARSVRIAYLGYKYATLYHKKMDGTMLKIEKILKKNGVL